MLATLLLTLNLAAAEPVATPVLATPVTAPLAAAEGSQGIGRGLRNMLIGAAVAGAGVLTSMLSVGVMGLGLGTAFVVRELAGAPAANSIFGTGMLAGAVVFFLAATLVVGGFIWMAVNGMLVIIRLDPDYKPSPATEYLTR